MSTDLICAAGSHVSSGGRTSPGIMHSRSSFSFFSDDDMMFCLLVIDLKTTVLQISPSPRPQIIPDESVNSSVTGFLDSSLALRTQIDPHLKGLRRANFWSSAIIFHASLWVS
jgi:hypothetical protein